MTCLNRSSKVTEKISVGIPDVVAMSGKPHSWNAHFKIAHNNLVQVK